MKTISRHDRALNRAAHVAKRERHPLRKYFALDCEGDGQDFKGCAFVWEEHGQAVRYFAAFRAGALAQWDRLAAGGYHIAVAHNAGYDLGTLFPQPFPDDLAIELIGGELLTARYHGVTVWDSYSLASLPLQEIGLLLGVPKLDMPDWLIEQHGEDISEQRWAEVAEYACRDAEIVLRLVQHFEAWAETHNVSLSPRVGSLAVAYWTQTTPYPMPRASAEEQEWGRRALYPGRAEAYAIGSHEHVETWDVNSMYPHCMTDPFPDPRTAFDSDNPEDLAHASAAILDATVTVPAGCLLPVLPFRYKDEVFYPTGTFRGTWPEEELVYASSIGAATVETLHHVHGYAREIEPFARFVDTLYEEKQAARDAGDHVREYFAKRVLNALWGRLALRTGSIQRVHRADTWSPAACGHCPACRRGDACEKLPHLRRTGAYWLAEQYKGEPPDYLNPTWAAFITSRARVYLHQLMTDPATDQPITGLVRCHTDSITTTQSHFQHSTAIGGLKREYSGPMEVRGPNAILRADGGRVAGVPRKHAETFLTTGRAEIHRPLSLAEGLATNQVSWWKSTILDRYRQETPLRAEHGARPWTVDEIKEMLNAKR